LYYNQTLAMFKDCLLFQKLLVAFTCSSSTAVVWFYERE
jgi:hypothetical protein